MTIPASWFLTLAALLFGIGAFGLLTRRSALIMFMCVELMLNAVNLTFVTFSNSLNDVAGQASVFFVMVVAAAGNSGAVMASALMRLRLDGASVAEVAAAARKVREAMDG